MNQNYPTIDYENFKNHDWTSFYGNNKEAVPLNAPEPRGKSVQLCAMVDSDHTGDKEDQHSHTGYMIFVQMALIDWLSRKQVTMYHTVFEQMFYYDTRDRDPLWITI